MKSKSAQKGYNAKLQKEMFSRANKCAEVLDKKGTDWGFSNFEDAALIAGVITRKEFTREDVAAIMVGLKLSRYASITWNNATPLHEPLTDTIIDAMNYINLMERERRKDVDQKGRQAEETES